MDVCPHCGATNPEGSKFCMYCGGSMTINAANSQYTVNSDQGSYNPSQQSYYQPAYNYQQPAYTPAPQHVNNVGLIIWSIVTILLSTIPGIVALTNALAVNKCSSAEEQQKKIKNAKIWCIVGCVIGVLYIIINMA